MMAGGLAVIYELKFNTKNKPITYVFYLIIIVCSIFINSSYTWPGYFTILPVLSTLLIIICNYNEGKIISNLGVQFIGKISYSLYLWHWPIIVTFLYFGIPHFTLNIIIIILLAFIFAYISYRFIETNKRLNVKVIFLFFLPLCFVVYFFSNTYSNKSMFKKDAYDIANYRSDSDQVIKAQMSNGICFMESSNQIANWKKNYNLNTCLQLSDTKKNILIIGDSHGAVLSKALKDSLNRLNFNVLMCFQASAMPIFEKYDSGSLFNFIFNDFLPYNSSKINGIILTGRWNNLGIDINHDSLITLLKNRITQLNSIGIPSIVIGQNEEYNINYPSIAALQWQYKINSSALYISNKSLETNKALLESTELKNYYINIFNVCNPKINEQKIPYIYDTDHFSIYGAQLAVHEILRCEIMNKFLCFNKQIVSND